MLPEQCQVIEQLDAAHKSNLMHSQIKLLTGRKRDNNTTTCIEDKNGDIIMEKDENLSRWSEYMGELYNDDNRGDMPDIAAEVESPITRREVGTHYGACQRRNHLDQMVSLPRCL